MSHQVAPEPKRKAMPRIYDCNNESEYTQIFPLETQHVGRYLPTVIMNFRPMLRPTSLQLKNQDL